MFFRVVFFLLFCSRIGLGLVCWRVRVHVLQLNCFFEVYVHAVMVSVSFFLLLATQERGREEYSDARGRASRLADT